MRLTGILILVASLCWSCGPAGKRDVDRSPRIAPAKRGSLYDTLDEKSFSSRATRTYDLDANAQTAAFSLVDAPQTVRCNLPLRAERVLAVQMQGPKGFAIDRPLILGREFYFEKNRFSVMLDLPILYFLNGHARFDLKILALAADGSLIDRSLTCSFSWLPMKAGSEAPYSFDYVPLTRDGLRQADASVRKQLNGETDLANMSRWSEATRKRVQNLLR